MAFQERCDREPVTDLWRKGPDAAAPEMPAFGYNSTCTGMQGTGARPAGCHPGPKGDLWHGGYEDSLLEQQVLEVIRRHDPARPLFLFWAPHIAHAVGRGRGIGRSPPSARKQRRAAPLRPGSLIARPSSYAAHLALPIPTAYTSHFPPFVCLLVPLQLTLPARRHHPTVVAPASTADVP